MDNPRESAWEKVEYSPHTDLNILLEKKKVRAILEVSIIVDKISAANTKAALSFSFSE